MQAAEGAIDRLAARDPERDPVAPAATRARVSPVASIFCCVEQYPKRRSVTKPLAGAHRIVTRCRESASIRRSRIWARCCRAARRPAGEIDRRRTPPGGASAPIDSTSAHRALEEHEPIPSRQRRLAAFSSRGDFAPKQEQCTNSTGHELGTWEASDGVLHLRFKAGASWSSLHFHGTQNVLARTAGTLKGGSRWP